MLSQKSLKKRKKMNKKKRTKKMRARSMKMTMMIARTGKMSKKEMGMKKKMHRVHQAAA